MVITKSKTKVVVSNKISDKCGPKNHKGKSQWVLKGPTGVTMLLGTLPKQSLPSTCMPCETL